jgi:hypothetical protein
MGAHTKLAQTILSRGDHYLLALKDNQRNLANKVALIFNAAGQRALCPFETVDADHGRIETRCAPSESRLSGLKAITIDVNFYFFGGNEPSANAYQECAWARTDFEPD